MRRPPIRRYRRNLLGRSRHESVAGCIARSINTPLRPFHSASCTGIRSSLCRTATVTRLPTHATVPASSFSPSSRSLTTKSSSTSASSSSSSSPSSSFRLASNEQHAFIAFARWLAQHGVRFSGSDGRPLFGAKRLSTSNGSGSSPDSSSSSPLESNWILCSANRTLQKGSTLFRLPIKLAIGPKLPDAMRSKEQNAMESKQQRNDDEMEAWMSNRIPDEMWSLRSGMRILREAARMQAAASSSSNSSQSTSTGSFYAPYLLLLPRSFPTIPLFWRSPELDALQYEPVQSQVKMRSSLLRKLSRELNEKNGNAPSLAERFFGSSQATEMSSPEMLAWGMSCSSSRAFQLWKGAQYNLPLVDLMNHSPDPTCKVRYDPAASEVVVEVVRDVPPQTELTIDYSGGHRQRREAEPHSDAAATAVMDEGGNDHLLLDYGFLLDNNPSDALLLARKSAIDGLELARDVAGEGGNVAKGDIPSAATSSSGGRALMEVPWKAHIVRTQGLAGSSVEASLSSSPASSSFVLTRSSIDPKLIALVHLLLAPSSTPASDSERNWDFYIASSAPSTTSSDHSSQDLSNQPPQVLRVLHSYLTLIQSSFATSLNEDLDALKQLVERIMTQPPPIDEAARMDAQIAAQREEMALRFRISKKRIVAEQLHRLQRIMRHTQIDPGAKKNVELPHDQFVPSHCSIPVVELHSCIQQ